MIKNTIPEKLKRNGKSIGMRTKSLRSKRPSKEKFYALIEFPYPRQRTALGHIRAFSSMEVVARMKRLQGYNVLSNRL